MQEKLENFKYISSRICIMYETRKKTVTAARLRQKKCLPKKVLFEKKMVDTLTHM